MISPPTTEAELLARARDLCGLTAGDLARRMGVALNTDPVRAKGKVGELMELALGATAGNLDQPDFPGLGVELKTVSMDGLGRVRESTFVCTLDLEQVEREEWGESRVWRKLRRVLWFPVEAAPGEAPGTRRLGRALLWSPTPAQEAGLRADWEALTGAIAVGGIEEISAHMGEALQIRPKAANSSVKVDVITPEGILIPTVPCGFYLRARFTAEVLWNLAGEECH